MTSPADRPQPYGAHALFAWGRTAEDVQTGIDAFVPQSDPSHAWQLILAHRIMPEPLPPNNTANESEPSTPSIATPSRVEMFETPDGARITDVYDHLGRLLSRTETLPGEGPHCAVFRYDGAGNQ